MASVNAVFRYRVQSAHLIPCRDKRVRYLALISKVILFLLLLSFAVKNSETVTLRYILGWEWQSPLSLLLLLAFALGLVLGMIVSTRQVYRFKREIARLNKTHELADKRVDKPLQAGNPG